MQFLCRFLCVYVCVCVLLVGHNQYLTESMESMLPQAEKLKTQAKAHNGNRIPGRLAHKMMRQANSKVVPSGQERENGFGEENLLLDGPQRAMAHTPRVLRRGLCWITSNVCSKWEVVPSPPRPTTATKGRRSLPCTTRTFAPHLGYVWQLFVCPQIEAHTHRASLRAVPIVLAQDVVHTSNHSVKHVNALK